MTAGQVDLKNFSDSDLAELRNLIDVETAQRQSSSEQAPKVSSKPEEAATPKKRRG